MLPGTPYNQQIANCCKGGVINLWAQEPNNYATSFKLSVGAAGTTNKTVKPHKNYTLLALGPGYSCGPVVVGKPSKFISSDGRRVTQAMMTWNVTCTYSQFLAQKTPTCCVSLSSFYNATHPGSCVEDNAGLPSSNFHERRLGHIEMGSGRVLCSVVCFLKALKQLPSNNCQSIIHTMMMIATLHRIQAVKTHQKVTRLTKRSSFHQHPHLK